jgi:hypothetical protein
MKKMGASTLEGIRAAEKTLKREEFKDLLGSLPDGHPLRDEADRVSEEAGGDLAGLPDNHPLIMQLKQAKERYDASIAEETEEAQEGARELKKAKKLSAVKKRRERIAQQEGRDLRHREAAKSVNSGIDDVLKSVKGLYEILAAQEETLNADHLTRNRMLRLKRMLYATERGLSDSRINRIANHGR